MIDCGCRLSAARVTYVISGRAAKLVKNLGAVRFHSRAQAGGHDKDVQLLWLFIDLYQRKSP